MDFYLFILLILLSQTGNKKLKIKIIVKIKNLKGEGVESRPNSTSNAYSFLIILLKDLHYHSEDMLFL